MLNIPIKLVVTSSISEQSTKISFEVNTLELGNKPSSRKKIIIVDGIKTIPFKGL